MIDARREFPIVIPLRRDVARLFLGMFHDTGLIHHVPMPERDELLQVVGEQFPADVDPVRTVRPIDSAGVSKAG